MVYAGFGFTYDMYSDLDRFKFQNTSVHTVTFPTCIQEDTGLKLPQKTDYHWSPCFSKDWLSLISMFLSVLAGKLRDTASSLTTAAAFALFPIQSSLHSPSHNINNSAAFWKIPRLRPFVLLVKATCRWRWVWDIGGMILTGENRSTCRSNHSSAPLPITNLRRTDPWLKPELRG
jgi:hypothetical protein